ncbi:MAG: amidohydrolase family protein [Proteobacteria bacterium]|nr:amidohydrolase family protein [Pseudomonadota bacterium]
MSRIVIKGGAILTMDAQRPDLAQGDLVVDGGRIAAIGPGLPAIENAETIDAAGMIVMPGLVNGHLHTWQSALRGIAGDWTVGGYMQAMHRGLATLYRPEDIFIANLMGALNQINSGTTTLVDWCHNNPTPAHTDAAIDGLAEAGIRGVFLHGSPKPDPRPGQPHFSEIPMPRNEIERLRKGRFAGGEGLLRLGLAILGPSYSTYEVTREDVVLGRELDLLTSMHVGGGPALVPDGLERLLAADLVWPNFNIVHGNDIAPQTIRRLIGRGASFTVTAEIELQMGYGDPLTGAMHELNAPMSIGTDVEAAARGDMFTAMRVTLQHERNRAILRALERTGARPVQMPLTCRDALAWATIQGARIAGLDRRVGSLAIGKEADIVLLRASDISMFPVRDLVSSVVMQGGVASVDTVLIGGRIVKRDGRLCVADLGRHMEELRRSGDRILAEFELMSRQAV